MPVLSIVVPLFDEEQCVDTLIRNLTGVLESLDLAYEVILVDDGSRDKTWDMIKASAMQDSRVKGISLSRNFGHQKALLAGLHHASGQAIVSMDGDLQHPPEIISQLFAAWNQGYKVVNTLRIESQETTAFKRLTSRCFYRLFSFLSGLRMSKGNSDFRLIDRQVLEALLQMRELDLFLRGIVNWVGFPSTTITYRANNRLAGKSKYSLKKMIRFSTAALVSFSSIPLKLGTWLGIATAFLALLEIIYIFTRYLQGQTVPGWASVLTVISFMFAVLFVLLGIMGTYLASIHETIKNRPHFLINDQIGFDNQ
jgi:dolichol-phosphate mannosyltransferase